jgi:hypothetical protein
MKLYRLWSALLLVVVSVVAKDDACSEGNGRKVTLSELKAFYAEHDPPKAAEAENMLRDYPSEVLVLHLMKEYGASPLSDIEVRRGVSGLTDRATLHAASSEDAWRAVTLDELTAFYEGTTSWYLESRRPNVPSLLLVLPSWDRQSTTRPRRPGRRRSCATIRPRSW